MLLLWLCWGRGERETESSRDVAILLIFDDVEVLDFYGPLEVFSVATREHNLNPFHVHTVAENSSAVMARNKLKKVL